MHEHIRLHRIIIPHKTMLEVIFDGVHIDIGKISLTDIPVESPDAHIYSKYSSPCLKTSLLGIESNIERISGFWGSNLMMYSDLGISNADRYQTGEQNQ